MSDKKDEFLPPTWMYKGKDEAVLFTKLNPKRVENLFKDGWSDCPTKALKIYIKKNKGLNGNGTKSNS